MQGEKLKTIILISLSLILLSSFLILNSTVVSAYTETTDGGQLSAEVYPENPRAFTQTSVHLVSYEVDLNRSNIIWTINGKKQKRGIGENDINFTTGEVGKKIIVEVEVNSQDGKRIIKTISMIPAEVDLLWQSDGYVPPFYKGKSLATAGSAIKIVALSNFVNESGTKLDPSKLVYKWETNGNNLTSGYGKSSVLVNINSTFENRFSVYISNLDGTLHAVKSLAIRLHPEEILFYEVSPLVGTIYNKALANIFEMNETEKVIRAEPYFFGRGNLTYLWNINDFPTEPSDGAGNQLTIRRPENNGGESLLGVKIDSLYQSGEKSIKIKFKQGTPGF